MIALTGNSCALSNRQPEKIPPVRTVDAGAVGGVIDLDYSPDGRYVLSAHPGKTAILWETDTWTCKSTFSPEGDIAVLANTFDFMPDCNHAVMAVSDKTLRMWDLETGEKRTIASGYSGTGDCAITPDGKAVLAVSGEKQESVTLWDIETGKEIRTFSGSNDTITAMAISPDGALLLLGGQAYAEVWDVSSGTLKFKLVPDSSVVINVSGSNYGPDTPQVNRATIIATSISFSSDGTRALVADDTPSVNIWDVGTGSHIKGYIGYGPCAALTPDGKYALAQYMSDYLVLVDIDTNEVKCTFEGHSSFIRSLAISPDGHWAVSGGASTIRVWDLEAALND
jgi:WD40 repeat protein